MDKGNITTISQLYKHDLEEAYLFFIAPSSFETKLRFLNKNKYQVHDYPPNSTEIFNMSHTCAAGDAIPVLSDLPPPEYLKKHWKTWLPASFSPAKLIKIEEGLKKDGVPIVTLGSFEDIPKSKHYIDPDELHRLQSKSCIPKIGVPCPHYMDPTNLQYPCVVKPDLGYLGHGIFKADNEGEMLSTIKKLRQGHGWKGQIVYQKYIQDIKEVRSHLFYLTKSCQIIWLGTNEPLFKNQFEWCSMKYDWSVQDQQRDAVYDEFVIPISKYLHQNSYFGAVNMEIVENEQGRYLVDLNVRLGGETAHHLIAPHMANKLLTFSYFLHIYPAKEVNKRSPEELVERANQLNQEQQKSCVIVCGVDYDQDDNFEAVISIFGNSWQDCDAVFERLKE